MLKILGALLTVAAGGGLGGYLTRRLHSRVTALQHCEDLLCRMAMLLRCTALPLEQLVDRVAQQSDARDFGFFAAWNAMTPGDFRARWVQTVKSADLPLATEDKQILRDFGEGLGSSDALGQLDYIALFRERFAAAAEGAKQRAATYARVLPSLGILGGGAVALLML